MLYVTEACRILWSVLLSYFLIKSLKLIELCSCRWIVLENDCSLLKFLSVAFFSLILFCLKYMVSLSLSLLHFLSQSHFFFLICFIRLITLPFVSTFQGKPSHQPIAKELFKAVNRHKLSKRWLSQMIKERVSTINKWIIHSHTQDYYVL